MQHFDVAVIGAGVPGLAAAVLLARANRRVIVLDPDDEPGGILVARSVNGMSFASGPVITHGFEPGGPLRLLYAALGMPLSTEMTASAFQVALPDRRITVHPEPTVTLEELRREYRTSFDGIVSLYQDLQERSRSHRKSRIASFLADRRSARAYLTSRGIDPLLVAFFDVQARFFFGLPIDRLSLSALADMVSFAPLNLPQGFHGVARQLRDQLTTVGGEYHGGIAWPTVHTSSSREVSIDTGDEPILARAAIVNTPWRAGSSLFMGVQEGVVPVNMQTSVLCLPAYDRPDDLNILTLHGPADPQTGIRPLTASFLAQGVAQQVQRERVGSIMPFFETGLALSEDMDHNARTYPFPRGWERTVAGSAEGMLIRPDKGMRHLYLLRDRVHAVNAAVVAARGLAERLA